MKVINSKKHIFILMSAVFALAAFWSTFPSCSSNSFAESKIYHIGRDSSWYPLDLRGKEISLVGFANDLLDIISQEQGFRVHTFEVGPSALFDGLDAGNYDGVLSSLTPNFMNQEKYAFSDPFYLVGPVLIVPVSSQAHSLKDMEGRIIGIESGSLQVFNIPEPPNVVMVPYNTASEALENLDKNVIDGVILDALRAYVSTEGFYAGRLKVVSSPLTNKGLRLITRKDPEHLNLISRFNEGLKAIKNQGTYAELVKKWGLINTEPEKALESTKLEQVKSPNSPSDIP